jgi:hypothetical protein
MKQENNIPVNLYGIMDSELTRMHDLMRVYLAMPKEEHRYSAAHTSYGGGGSAGGAPSSPLGEIYKRITTMQDLLFQALISHDRELQERIAELALTGNSETK